MISCPCVRPSIFLSPNNFELIDFKTFCANIMPL